ncbi:MAG TPA: M14 family zinc carboxypeptidase [Xanthomonadaceae bacterium]|nr:M14 family zinc carboxypeptidase [Xanthomonadaceae bacterium]
MRLRTALLLSLLPLAGAAASGPVQDEDAALAVVTVHYRDRAELQQAAARFQHMLVDERARTARAEASYGDVLALRRLGLRVDIDRAASRRLQQADQALRAAFAARRSGRPAQALAARPAESIPRYACYRTVEETYATMDQLAAAHPTLAKVVDIGPTWLASRGAGGYRMRALQLTNAATDARLPDKPTMVVFASIHAREYTPAELLTRFGEWLANGHGSDPQATWLLDNFRFDLVLQANPDGRKKAEAGALWRKNANTSNGSCNASDYGIDLNRNFGFRWNSVAGGSSSDPCASTYHGPRAGSEPETNNLLRYVAGTRGSDGVHRGGVLPDRRNDDTVSAAPSSYRGMFLDLHSYSQLVLWPWSYTQQQPPNAVALRTLGRRLAWFNGYQAKQWVYLYPADGTDTDAIYGLLGAPSYTIEFGTSFFEDCATFEGSTLPRNTAALKYAARNLYAPYVYPGGPDTTALTVFPSFVVPGKPATITATVDDSLYSQAIGSEPVQAIASAAAWLDDTPWADGARPIAMAATDGRFDAPRESASVVIQTGGLAPGRHVVFVQGTDASGARGTPQAVYFTVAKLRALPSATTGGGGLPARRSDAVDTAGHAARARPPRDGAQRARAR